MGLGKIFKAIAPLAASAGANFLLPGSGAAAGALVGGIMGGKGTKKSSKQTFEDILRASRPNQANAQGDTLEWTTDPKTGQAVQTVKYGAEKQKASDSFQRLAANRMAFAEGLDPSGKSYQADYEKMGLGALLGGDTGTTGKRPWADDKYSSMGGDALKYLQYSGPGPDIPMTQSWGSQPIPGAGPAAPPPQPPVQTMPNPVAAGGGLLGKMIQNQIPPGSGV